MGDVLQSIPKKQEGWVNVTAQYDGLYDGDTIYVKVQNADGITERKRIRLDSINAPELHQVDGAMPTGQLATDHLKEYFAGSPSLTLTLSPEQDKYGRLIGYVKRDDKDESANYMMLNDGYAHLYDGFAQKSLASQPDELAKYQKAAADAKTDKKGIWANPAGAGANEDPDIWRDKDEEAKSRSVVPIILTAVSESDEVIQKLTVFRNGTPMNIGENSVKIISQLDPGQQFVSFQIKAVGASGTNFDTRTVGVSRLEDSVAQFNKYEETVTLYKNTPRVDVTVTFSSGDDPVEGVQASLGSYKETTDADGEVVLTADEGNLSISWKCDGYAPGSRVVKVSADNHDFEIALVKKGDQDAAQITNKAAENASSAVQNAERDKLNSLELPSIDPEQIDESNTSYENYFTCAQTRMYIGQLFIDELISIQWNLSENAVPVFGYASRFFDALAEGRSMVQGQITINYVAPWYLGMAIQEHHDKSPGPDQEPRDSDVEQLAYRITEGFITPQELSEFTPDQIALAKQRAAELKGMGGDYKEQPCAVYKRLVFNTVLEFGDRTKKNRRMLVNCKLTSCEQIVDPSGSVIAESYGFVAQRVI